MSARLYLDMSKTYSSARLALSDGTIWRGEGFGAVGRGACVSAEVVFNTAMLGYQESLTDPSYAGQILVQTAPLIGNTGVNGEDEESGRVQVSGLVVHELAGRHSNFRATGGLSGYLERFGVLGWAGVDTRALTRVLRTRGVTPGVLTDDEGIGDGELVERARAARGTDGQNLAALAGCARAERWSGDLGAWGGGGRRGGRAWRVLALDCGGKRNIYRHLSERGCEVEVARHDTGAEEIRGRFERGEIDGLFISNGPGDPAAVEVTVGVLAELIARPTVPEMPIFGICLGHQLLALAVGARTYKLRFGHRGANQPVRNGWTGRVEITSQNHGYAVEEGSLRAAGGAVTHVHLNDGTVAGFELEGRPVFGVQFHPEASPGPHDAGGLFDRFVGWMEGARGVSRARAGAV